MKRVWSVLALLVGVSLFSGIAHAQYCGPTSFTGNEFPKGNFFSNFDNSCYLIPLASGSGQAAGGDLNSIYQQVFYQVNPNYQLIILGSFPNARYFSITDYDAHGATTQFLLDADIVPLTSSFINPYEPGTAYVSDQKYAVPINFGGTPGNEQTGCKTNGYNIEVNAIDGTQRHPGMDWNADPNVFRQNSNFGLHIVDTPTHSNPNTAGDIMLRNYISLTTASPETSPFAILRDVASGCAYPAAYALSLNVVSNVASTGNAWLDSAQADLHREYEHVYLPRLCFATDKRQVSAFSREAEYIPGALPDGSYIIATLPSGLPANLTTEGRLMQISFRIPTTPDTPCTSGGCFRTGNEQLRYMSLSFEGSSNGTLASLADSAFVQNPEGYVTLIVGTGTPVPSWVTAANGYTYLDLTAISGYSELTKLEIRNIEPAGTFSCSGYEVPYLTNEYTPAGGFMGEYLPVVTYPTAATLPQTATPLVQPDNCTVFPDGVPAVLPTCAIDPPNSLFITALTTQCAAPGCNQVVEQAQPPITIVGNGFGSFPNGLPFTGTSNYLEITDTTQGWSAGYSGDSCTVAISGWANDLIELVANVNQNGVCPLAAGDTFTVQVTNPQSGSMTSSTVTVQAN